MHIKCRGRKGLLKLIKIETRSCQRKALRKVPVSSLQLTIKIFTLTGVAFSWSKTSASNATAISSRIFPAADFTKSKPDHISDKSSMYIMLCAVRAELSTKWKWTRTRPPKLQQASWRTEDEWQFLQRWQEGARQCRKLVLCRWC